MRERVNIDRGIQPPREVPFIHNEILYKASLGEKGYEISCNSEDGNIEEARKVFKIEYESRILL